MMIPIEFSKEKTVAFAVCVWALVQAQTAVPVAAAVWQWMAEVPDAVSGETGELPKAFLWIPPNCERVRAVIVGQHNMEEEPIFEHPTFRKALAELNIAVVWVTPNFDPFFRFDLGAGERFNAMMEALANVSGYAELARCPVMPIGHSALASYPWNFAAWNPQRTLAAISVSGQWPIWDYEGRPEWDERSIDGVPGLVTIGEYEWANDRGREGAKQRSNHPHWPLSMLAEPGGGHFDVSDAKIEYLALYLRKVCQYRLNGEAGPDGSTTLRQIDPTREGWLVDRWRRDREPQSPSAPVAEYAGQREDAFWYFDEEHARATEAFGEFGRGKQVQLLGYMQGGEVLPQVAGTHQQVTIPFRSLDGGPQFQLTGAFLDVVPAGRPERWTGKKAGESVSHGDDVERIRIERICGPVRQLNANTFEVCVHRLGLNNTKRSSEVWLMASHPGDNRYRRSVQQAMLRVPIQNREGADQEIAFPEISDQSSGVDEVRLEATSTAELPIDYFVLYGPAEVDGQRLRLQQIPPQAKYPVEIAVVAWQWGRIAEPMFKTAQPVSRTFRITR